MDQTTHLEQITNSSLLRYRSLKPSQQKTLSTNGVFCFVYLDTEQVDE